MKKCCARFALRCLTLLFLAWAGLSLLAAVFYPYLLYHPVQEIDLTLPREGGPDWEDIWLTDAGGTRLNGWFVHAVPEPPAKMTLLIFHGNAGSLSSAIPRLRGYAESGLDVFMPEYPGFGLSEGSPSEAGLYMTADAAWRYLTAVREIQPQNIIIAGYSLGGAVAAQLAERHPEAGGLILESSFTSLADVAADLFPWLPCSLILGRAYGTLDRLPNIRLPLLVIHGRGDQLVAWEYGQKIFNSYQGNKQFFTIGNDHNIGFLSDSDSYFAVIYGFATSQAAGGAAASE